MAQNQLGGKSFHVLDVRGPVSRSYEFAITDEISRAIFEGMSAPADGQFLRTLTRNLAIAVQVRFAFIATLLEAKPGYARLSAMWTGNGFGESFSYALEGTPCEYVYTDKLVLFPDNLQQKFPHDTWLRELGAES